MAQWQFIPGRGPSDEAKQLLSDLGYDMAAYLGGGGFGDVYNGVCNQFAKKLVAVQPNEIQSTPGAYFEHISNRYVREVSLNGQSCAIKVLDQKKQWNDQLYTEAKSLIDLDHPNIVEIYSVCKFDDIIYIIMEYLNGGTLMDFLYTFSSEAKMDEFTALQIIRQLTAGLQYLHNQNKVHRDLHNQNIMLSVQNNKLLVKLVDFGTCEALEGRNNMTDIIRLSRHLTQVLDKSLFVSTNLQENLRDAFNLMNNSVFTDMNQVVNHLSRYLPSSDAPTPRNSLFNRFARLFSKK